MIKIIYNETGVLVMYLGRLVHDVIDGLRAVHLSSVVVVEWVWNQPVNHIQL